MLITSCRLTYYIYTNLTIITQIIKVISCNKEAYSLSYLHLRNVTYFVIQQFHGIPTYYNLEYKLCRITVQINVFMLSFKLLSCLGQICNWDFHGVGVVSRNQ